MKTFFLNGIPPLDECSGSKSRGSTRSVVSKEKHEDAVLFEQTFGLFPDNLVCRQDTTFLWQLYEVAGCSND